MRSGRASGCGLQFNWSVPLGYDTREPGEGGEGGAGRGIGCIRATWPTAWTNTEAELCTGTRLWNVASEVHHSLSSLQLYPRTVAPGPWNRGNSPSTVSGSWRVVTFPKYTTSKQICSWMAKIALQKNKGIRFSGQSLHKQAAWTKGLDCVCNNNLVLWSQMYYNNPDTL